MPVAFPEPRDAAEAEGMKVLHAAVTDKAKWLDDVMKKNVPERIYRLAHYGSKRGQLISKKWLDRNNFEIREAGTMTQILVKGEVVGTHNFNCQTTEAPNGE